MSYYRFFLLLYAFCVGSFIQTISADDFAAPSELVKKSRVGFFLRSLNVRGVEVATYDYAHFNETILGNESFIFYVNVEKVTEGDIDYPTTVRKKFQERFRERFYECANFEEVESVILKEHIDVLYNLKVGTVDDNVSRVCKNAIHAVYLQFEIHGDAYATISEWMRDQAVRSGMPGIPVVPHIVRLEETSETLHEELGIPRGAVVFGRHGGYWTFSVQFVLEAVTEIAQTHPDWYFVFLNTPSFCQLPNVIFLPATADMIYKTKFINTCDAMIHAANGGETFGLACAEFSIKNKPVMTYLEGVGGRAHIAMLGDKGLYYRNKEELKSIIESCGKNIDEIRRSNWDAYSERYNPKVVMEQFDAIFLKPLRNKSS